MDDPLAMQVLSINVAQPQAIAHGNSLTTTGIYKRPVRGPVMIDRDGLAGDTIVDTVNHGGPDQAVYLYGRDDYDWWEEKLQRPLANGVFGENITVQWMTCERFAIGDRLQIGATVLEVSCPRIPCHKLSTVMADAQFAKTFRRAARPGIYCRVVTPGRIAVDDPLVHEPYTGDRITIRESFAVFSDKSSVDRATIERFLAAPIDARARGWLTAALAKTQ